MPFAHDARCMLPAVAARRLRPHDAGADTTDAARRTAARPAQAGARGRLGHRHADAPGPRPVGAPTACAAAGLDATAPTETTAMRPSPGERRNWRCRRAVDRRRCADARGTHPCGCGRRHPRVLPRDRRPGLRACLVAVVGWRPHQRTVAATVRRWLLQHRARVGQTPVNPGTWKALPDRATSRCR